MKKIFLSALALYFSIVAGNAQSPAASDDSSAYKSRKLKLEEINFVSGYYSQDGNNSAVTGGIGTEQLTDISNLLELKFIKPGKEERSHLLNFQVGLDAYSSASSDKIDPSTVSSASKSDRRIYPSVSYGFNNKKRGYTLGASGYFSTEYDYTSIGTGLNFSKISKDKNKEFLVKFQAFFDNWKIILPVELRNQPDAFTQGSNRNSYNSALIYSFAVNMRLQAAILAEPAYQNGLLSTPFHRVYFVNNDLKVEHLPDTRYKLPLGLRLNYFLGDRIVLRSFYRYYADSWKISAHTLSLEAPVKITPFLSVAPVYRFYNQSAAEYFAPYKEHLPAENFFTSDYDLSAFSSHLAGVNFRTVSASGILGWKRWNSFEVRYSYYYRSTKLTAHSVAVAFRFK
jgi:hypothetical protein